ncbi:MoaD/ThiS family protein [uncultured Methanobrevibacter sp.]|uniref:MoaD/ThiS family protein n=1 Tax=uncultured Methanobrevibacter sp. TaxID=253161 RepID=UPI0025F6E567|nr:MoaD/ThiS family protein [uncultured Methanobrevibacter sp.]
MSYKLIFKELNEERELSSKTTIRDVLEDLNISQETVVTKQNGDVVIEDNEIHDGDEIQIIQIIYGG